MLFVVKYFKIFNHALSSLNSNSLERPNYFPFFFFLNFQLFCEDLEINLEIENYTKEEK